MNTNVPRPRLCHLRRWPHFNGFGFNLHAERNKVGQFIGKVDPGSPAESAGLREHDRIIEVNYCPISNDSHKQVVQRIKDGVERGDTRNTDEVVLLVLDAAAWDYYNRKGIMPKSNDPNVEHLEAEDHGKPRTPEAPPSYKSTIDTEKPATVRPSTPIQREQPVAHYRNVTDFTGPTVTKTSEKAPSPYASKALRRHQEDDNDGDEEEDEDYLGVTPLAGSASALRDLPSIENRLPMTPPPNYSPSKFSPTPPRSDSPRNPPLQSTPASKYKVPELDMTAAELMAKLKAQRIQKKAAQQRNQMSMKDKHAFVEKL